MHGYRFVLIALLLAFWPVVVFAQDDLADQPEAQGTVVVAAEQPTIGEPEVGIETPDSSMPDDLETSPLPQWWQAVAGAISAGLTALLIRWTPSGVWRSLGAARSTDLKRGFGLVAAVVVGLIGAWIADTLAFDKVTLSDILYVAAAGWLSREVIPGFKGLTHSMEGAAPPAKTA